MTNSELFLKIYQELETIIKEKYDVSIDEFIESTKSKYILDNSYFLDTTRRLRNILTHYKDDSFELCSVSIDTINKLKEIKGYIESPIKAKDIYIPFTRIILAKTNDLILPIYKVMSEKGFSHIPIVSNKRVVVGVFDGNVLASSMLFKNNSCINSDFRFDNDIIKEYTKLDKQMFNQYFFINEECSIDDIKELFNKHHKDTRKISMLFVTKNGRSDEPLLGLITPNDILSKN